VLIPVVDDRWLALLAVIAEGLEFLRQRRRAPPGRDRRGGVTIGALGGAFVGGIVGTPFFVWRRRAARRPCRRLRRRGLAVRSEARSLDRFRHHRPVAAMRGRLLGFIVKSAIAVAMVGIASRPAVW
jgi:hypothetical protein